MDDFVVANLATCNGCLVYWNESLWSCCFVASLWICLHIDLFEHMSLNTQFENRCEHQ